MFIGTVLVGANITFIQDDSSAEQPSRYNLLGGLASISVVVSDFVDVLVPAPLLNKNPAIDAARAHVPPSYLKYHVTAMVCLVTGGPCSYHGRGMKEAHAHLNITQQEWARLVTLFKQVIAIHKVPAKESNFLLAFIDAIKVDGVFPSSS